MNQTLSIIIWSLTGALLCTASGIAVLKTTPETIKKSEQLTRNRYIGLIFGWFALLACVPHAAAVAPVFMFKFLYPLALLVPVIGFFCVDYAASRAVSGTLILCSYNLVHLSFDINAPGMSFFAVCGWILGAFSIWCSGLPWTWRDIFRKSADSSLFRRCTAGVLFLFAAIFIIFCGVGWL